LRRTDLTRETRAEIAYEAYKAQNSKNSYGRIVEIAKEYEVSAILI